MSKQGRYRPFLWNMLPGVLLFLSVVGSIALVWSALSGGPWLFMLFWLALVAWAGVDGLYRFNYQLEFDDAYLSWRGFMRSGKTPISDVVAVDTEFMGSVAVFVCRNGQKVRVVVLQGFAPFLMGLNQAHPSVVPSPGVYARFVERAQLGRKP